MVEMALVVLALTATLFAAIGAAVVGRWSQDLASRLAASLVTVGWIAAICLALVRRLTPGAEDEGDEVGEHEVRQSNQLSVISYQ